MLYHHMEDMIGHTPLLAAKRYQQAIISKANLFAKLEMFNPCGSAKDRIALKMIEETLCNGTINSETLLVEPTSGNTGIALAAIALAKHMKIVIVMPETMSDERKQLISAYGADLVLTRGELGMQGAIDEANRIVASHSNAFLVGQFDNTDNPKAHYLTTGPEIDEDMNGEIDIFVAGIGTGGTISGVGRYLKEKFPQIQIVGVEPEDSPLLTKGYSKSHGLQGIGANFVPSILDREVIDTIITATTQEAYHHCRMFRKTEGLLVGISSGAALSAAAKLSQKEENKGKRIVVLLPDGGERYLTTSLFRSTDEEK